MSDTHNQARRRSTDGVQYNSSSIEDEFNTHDAVFDPNLNVTVGYECSRYTLNVPDPDSNEITKALESRGIGGKRTDKQNLLEYFALHKADISARLPTKANADDMRTAIEECIPVTLGILKKKSVS